MDEQTKREMLIVMLASLAPIPLLTAAAALILHWGSRHIGGETRAGQKSPSYRAGSFARLGDGLAPTPPLLAAPCDSFVKWAGLAADSQNRSKIPIFAECLGRFCIPTTGAEVPAGPEQLHEIKYDSFRLRIERDGDRVRLICCSDYH